MTQNGTDKKLIVGNAPIADDIVRQAHPAEVDFVGMEDNVDLSAYSDVFILGDGDDCDRPEEHDNRSIGWLLRQAHNTPRQARPEKSRCHLMLQSVDTFTYLQRNNLAAAIEERFAVFPFHMGNEWSLKIRLDHSPITIQSQQFAHLVIFGLGQMTQLAAVNMCLQCHFPNHTRNNQLRTRITVVDREIEAWQQQITQQYRHLFENCHYRVIDTAQKEMVTYEHRPENLDHLGDFVDVEWEFVKADIAHPAIQAKLAHWATSPAQQLTLLLAHNDTMHNLRLASMLPAALAIQKTPIYLNTHDDTLLQATIPSADSLNLKAIGMHDSGYDIHLPYVKMAQTVNYINTLCYNDNIAGWTGRPLYAVEIDKEECKTLWDKLSALKRTSNICNARMLPIKMRSIGIDENDWDKFYDIPQQTIDVMAQVEHNRWSCEELLLGWRPCTAEEQRLVEQDVHQKSKLKEKKIHYDLRTYGDLRSDETGRSAAIYDICLSAALPLIAGAATSGQDL